MAERLACQFVWIVNLLYGRVHIVLLYEDEPLAGCWESGRLCFLPQNELLLVGHSLLDMWSVMELPAPPYYPALGENEGGSKKNTSTYSNVA